MSHSKAKKLVVVGQGYVGLPLAMRAVAVGLNVVGYDISEDRVMRHVLGRGNTRANEVAERTLAEVRAAMNMSYA